MRRNVANQIGLSSASAADRRRGPPAAQKAELRALPRQGFTTSGDYSASEPDCSEWLPPARWQPGGDGNAGASQLTSPCHQQCIRAVNRPGEDGDPSRRGDIEVCVPSANEDRLVLPDAFGTTIKLTSRLAGAGYRQRAGAVTSI